MDCIVYKRQIAINGINDCTTGTCCQKHNHTIDYKWSCLLLGTALFLTLACMHAVQFWYSARRWAAHGTYSILTTYYTCAGDLSLRFMRWVYARAPQLMTVFQTLHSNFKISTMMTVNWSHYLEINWLSRHLGAQTGWSQCPFYFDNICCHTSSCYTLYSFIFAGGGNPCFHHTHIQN